MGRTTRAAGVALEPSLPDPGGEGSPVDVAAALTFDDGTMATAAGHLIALPDSTATLCGGAVMDSAPPRCAEPFLVVVGVTDPASLPGAIDVGSWVEGPVVLAGTLREGRLVVP